MTHCVLRVQGEGGEGVARVLHRVDNTPTWLETMGPVVQLAASGEGQHIGQLKVLISLSQRSAVLSAVCCPVCLLLCAVHLPRQ